MASALELVLHDPPFGETRFQTTLVTSHVRASDPFLAWFRELVREVAVERIEGVGRQGR